MKDLTVIVTFRLATDQGGSQPPGFRLIIRLGMETLMGERQQPLFTAPSAPWELDEVEDRTVATVIFSAAPGGPFDYRVPDSLIDEVQAGKRVKVPLGRGNRLVTGYCVAVGAATGENVTRALKDVLEVVDQQALISTPMLELTEWMSDYYLCNWGQVLEAVVPAGVRSGAGTRRVQLLQLATEVAGQLSELSLPPKQRRVLEVLAESSAPMTPDQVGQLVGCTRAPIRACIKKGLIQTEMTRQAVPATAEPPVVREEALDLNSDQKLALDKIVESLDRREHETLLLYGVTGSGKTEVYIQAIEHIIGFGRQAVVLVPEISLTPQTRQRFRSRFDQVAVLHSHLSDAERHQHWRRIARGEVQVVVGARSAVFAPTPNLGLIVIDEEHDTSFKQDTIPRYHARDVALERARREGVPLVLGSATPSLESWVQAQKKQFQLATLPRRIADRPLPDVKVVDLRHEGSQRRGSISRPLYRAMEQALAGNGQIILLLNRRGYSTSIQCPSCGEVVRCPHCDIALTHHRVAVSKTGAEQAICHYCEYMITAPDRCGECGFDGIRYAGLGTQRLEAEVRARFPQASCLRMDSDTMRKVGSHEEALARFRAGEVQILLGTQMIAKGLDFPNVTLVGVINADTALHFPDFRAAERTFQLVTQVAGRTGRSARGGRVLVQTFSPEHPAIAAAVQHDYLRFVSQELPTRQQFGYPPATEMIRLIVRGEQEATATAFCQELADRLQAAFPAESKGLRLLGPAPAPIAKLRGKYRLHVLLIDSDRERLRQVFRQATTDLPVVPGVQWVIDVDPWSLL